MDFLYQFRKKLGYAIKCCIANAYFSWARKRHLLTPLLEGKITCCLLYLEFTTEEVFEMDLALINGLEKAELEFI